MPSLFSRLSQATRVLFGREERSVPSPDTLYSTGFGKGHLFKPTESLKAMDDNVHLRSSVLKIAQEIARTPFHLKKVNPKGEIQYVEKHQALETLRFPQTTKSGKSMLTGMDLKLITGMHLLLNGEAFWLLDKRLTVGGAPTNIQPLLPGYMYLKTDKFGDLTEYVYRLPSGEINFDPLDIVHFKLPDPQDMYRGNSPVRPLRWAIETTKEADELNANRIQNNAVPAGVITTESILTPEQQQKYLAQWKEMYGGSRNASKVAMMPKGLDFKEVQQTNADMQYVEGKQMNRDDILAAYGIGLEILGKTESQTRANADTAVYVFQRFGVLYFLEKIVDTLNADYLPAFPGTDSLEFGFPDPVPANMEDKRANVQTLFQIGAVTPNEVRKEFGLEPLKIDGMDIPYIDLGKVPIESPPLVA